jgi:hypothetical protein
MMRAGRAASPSTAIASALALVVGGATACAPGSKRAPVPPSARAALAVLRGDGVVLDVVRVRPPVELPLDDDVVDVVVLAYEVDVDALPYAETAPRAGDPPGVARLELVASGDPEATRLVAPAAWSVDGEAQPREAFPGPLEALRLRRAPCPSFDLAWVELPPNVLATFAAPWDADRAILGLESGCVDEVCTPARLAELGPRGALRALDVLPPLRARPVGDSSFPVGLSARPLDGGAIEVAIVETATIVARRRLSLDPPALSPAARDAVTLPDGAPIAGIDLLRLGEDEDWAIVEAGAVTRVLHRPRGERWSVVSSGVDRGVANRDFCDIGVPTQFLAPLGPGRCLVGATDQPIGEATPTGLARRPLGDEPNCRASYVAVEEGVEVVLRNPGGALESRYAWRVDGGPFIERVGGGVTLRGFAPLGPGVVAVVGQDVAWLDLRGLRLGVEPRTCPIVYSSRSILTGFAVPDGVVLSGRGRALWVGALDR